MYLSSQRETIRRELKEKKEKINKGWNWDRTIRAAETLLAFHH